MTNTLSSLRLYHGRCQLTFGMSIRFTLGGVKSLLAHQLPCPITAGVTSLLACQLPCPHYHGRCQVPFWHVNSHVPITIASVRSLLACQLHVPITIASVKSLLACQLPCPCYHVNIFIVRLYRVIILITNQNEENH